MREVLQQLPADSPAILITQHMPPGFTKSFATRLAGLCKIAVTEAQDGERVLPGHAYIAPGGRHMAIKRSGASYSIVLSDDEPVNRHKPSVEVLFRSVAASAGPNAAGIPAISEALSGREPSEELYAQAGAIAAASCSPVTDSRGTADYKRHLARVLCRRALTTAAA